MSVTEELFRPLLAGDTSRPLITHYDDAAGTRVELSVATMANWAAKTANWLTDEFDIEPGSKISVRLPAHWQTMGILLGAWWAGAWVSTSTEHAEVAFTTVNETAPGAHAHAVVSLDPMGMGLRGPAPGGALDYISESRISGDQYFPIHKVPESLQAIEKMTVGDVIAAAKAQSTSERVLSTMDWTFPDGIVTGVLGILAGGGSLVQVSNPARTDDHWAAERATLVLPNG
ncbi:MAG: TIGR03089 family protein [Kibdelosporangium sp.]